jgi:glutaminase
MIDYQKILEDILAEVRQEPNAGKVATYIPELAAVNPDQLGISLVTTDNRHCGAGDWEACFSIQSIVKVLSLSIAFRKLGKKIWKRVGVEPAGTPFNSLVQLEYEEGIPRNPFINSGALVICDILMSQMQDPKAAFLQIVRELSGNARLDYHLPTVVSEKSEGYRNFALINLIRSFGNIHNDVEEVLDFYFHLCSIRMNCLELSRTFLFLTNEGRDTISGNRILSKSEAKRINSIMMTCGFYDEAGEFAYEVGLPGKSGVGGGIVAVHPNQYVLTVWSPRLNPRGNSYRGMKVLEKFTTRTEASVF